MLAYLRPIRGPEAGGGNVVYLAPATLSDPGPERVSAGVCAPAGAQDFTLRAGGAPRAESGARRSGAEPAWGPKPQAEPRRGPPPTPPPARARAARRAPEPEPSGGAETAAAPVGCGDRAPGAAEPAPGARSPAPSQSVPSRCRPSRDPGRGTSSFPTGSVRTACAPEAG
ncbi:hypothetical protein AB1E18_015994 [Capra hircus]